MLGGQTPSSARPLLPAEMAQTPDAAEYGSLDHRAVRVGAAGSEREVAASPSTYSETAAMAGKHGTAVRPVHGRPDRHHSFTQKLSRSPFVVAGKLAQCCQCAGPCMSRCRVVLIADFIELGGPASRVDGIRDDGGIPMQQHAYNAALGDGIAESALPCAGFRVRVGPLVVSVWALLAGYLFAGAAMSAVEHSGTHQYHLFGTFPYTEDPAVALGTSAGLAVGVLIATFLFAQAAAVATGTRMCGLLQRLLAFRDTLGLSVGALVTVLALVLLVLEQYVDVLEGFYSAGVVFNRPSQRKECAAALQTIADAPVLRIIGALLPIVWFKRSALWDSTILLGGSSQASDRAQSMARDGIALDLARGAELLDGPDGLEAAVKFVDADIRMRLKGTCKAACCPRRKRPDAATREESSLSIGDGYGLFRPEILLSTLAVAYSWAGDAVVRPASACVYNPLASPANSPIIFGAPGVILALVLGAVVSLLAAQELVRCLEEPIALAQAWAERARLLLQAGVTPLELRRERVDNVDEETVRVVAAYAGARPALASALERLALDRVTEAEAAAAASAPGAASAAGGVSASERELRAARRMVLGGALVIHIDRAQAVLDLASPVLLVTVFSAIAYAGNLVSAVYSSGGLQAWLSNPANILDALADPVLYTTAAAFAAFYATAMTQSELTAGLNLLALQGTVRRLCTPGASWEDAPGGPHIAGHRPGTPSGADMPAWVHALTPRPHKGPKADGDFLTAVAKWRGFPKLLGVIPLPESLPRLFGAWVGAIVIATLPSLLIPSVKAA